MLKGKWRVGEQVTINEGLDLFLVNVCDTGDQDGRWRYLSPGKITVERSLFDIQI